MIPVSEGYLPGAYADRQGESRSAMARASDGLPFKPYVYHGGDAEPPAVREARERWRAREAEIERQAAKRQAELERAHAALDALQADREIGPDGPGPEWYRKMAAEAADEMAAAGQGWAAETLFTGAERALLAPPAAPRVPDPVLALWAAPADELAEMDAERERYQAAMARVPAPGPPAAPPPVTPGPAGPARRHRPCGYLRGSRGCKAVCGGE